MTVKTLKTAEEKETDKTREISRRLVHSYLEKINKSQERVRQTQIEINRLKKRTDAVLAKLT